MKLLKYDDYLTESLIYKSILESKVVYSDEFMNILKNIESRVSEELIKLSSNDIPTRSNFINTTKENDLVSFIPDKRAQELILTKPDFYIVNRDAYLGNTKVNEEIFKKLGYNYESSYITSGVIGIVLSEIELPNGRTYVLFECDITGWQKRFFNKDKNRGYRVVINKKFITKTDSIPGENIESKIPEINDMYKIAGRSDMKVGRLTKALLDAANVKVTTKEIEDFVNDYKSTFDVLSNKLIQFDIINGEDIAHWYRSKNYSSKSGSLANSCMRYASCKKFFDIYTKNTEVCSLVVLYDDDGKINKKGKYKSDKIKGRALLWKAKIDGKVVPYLDRIYTNDDSDVQLFNTLAKQHKWLIYAQLSRKKLTVQLTESDFKKYPYMDTFSHLNCEENILANYKLSGSKDRNLCRYLKCTDGSYDNF